ncbi:MAG: DUF58 domain-containing protein [Chloroflexota bacterium]|jgi:uncharacterized protein (DUF58 family)
MKGNHRRNILVVLALGALVGGLLTGRDLVYSLAYVLGLLIIASFAWAWASINWLHISRLTRTRRTQVGRPLEERFTLTNTSFLPKLWLEVHDYSDLPGHFASQVVHSIGNKEQYSWRVVTVCRQRGRYRLGPLRLNTSDPFGLFPMHRELSATTHIVVYPQTFEIHYFALPMGILPGGDALHRRTHHITTNVSGVRDYMPGDSFGRIHWPSTARRNRLMAKEFELDPLADIWIALDMSLWSHVAPRQQDLPEPDLDEMPWMQPDQVTMLPSTEEYAVATAASLAQYFLRQDRAVGMLGYGQSNEIVQADRGERQLNRILETLAVLRAKGEIPIQDMLNAESHLFARGTTLIVVTPTSDEKWAAAARQLARRGLRVVSVLINGESFGDPHSSVPLANLLAAGGMVSYVINEGDDLTAVLSQTIKKRGFVTV